MNECQDNTKESHWHGKTWYAYGTSLTSAVLGKYSKYVVECRKK